MEKNEEVSFKANETELLMKTIFDRKNMVRINPKNIGNVRTDSTVVEPFSFLLKICGEFSALNFNQFLFIIICNKFIYKHKVQ